MHSSQFNRSIQDLCASGPVGMAIANGLQCSWLDIQAGEGSCMHVNMPLVYEEDGCTTSIDLDLREGVSLRHGSSSPHNAILQHSDGQLRADSSNPGMSASFVGVNTPDVSAAGEAAKSTMNSSSEPSKPDSSYTQLVVCLSS